MAENSWSDVDSTPLGKIRPRIFISSGIEKKVYFSTATGEDDLRDAVRELTDVAASWRNIGTQLGIPDSRLEAIQGDKPLDTLRQMLATWLQKNYTVKRFGEPTWMKLVEVVSHSAGGGNPSLAMEIARRHKGTCSGITDS